MAIIQRCTALALGNQPLQERSTQIFRMEISLLPAFVDLLAQPLPLLDHQQALWHGTFHLGSHIKMGLISSASDD